MASGYNSFHYSAMLRENSNTLTSSASTPGTLGKHGITLYKVEFVFYISKNKPNVTKSSEAL